ncbi:efflux RND transporter periplasmic adaptor subunit [soil metagenome]
MALAATAWMSFRSPQVAAIEMQAAPLVRSLQFSARVATLSRVEVGSTITGRVVKVLVNDGALVRQGDLLVQLESDELRATLNQARASVNQTQARLAGLRSTGRAAARAAVMQSDATLRAAQAELLRSQQLVAQGFVSASRLDEAQRAVDVAGAQQASAQAQSLANADAGTDVVQAQAQLDQARAAITAAEAKLAQTQVVAPANARVLSRQVEPGQIVQPGKALLRLALAGPTQLIAQVDERFLEQLQTGQSTSVVADAFPDQRFSAKVLSIAPAVDAQRGAIEVKFSLDAAPPAYLREDMTLSVEVVTARRERVVALPLTALRSQTGSSSSSSATVLIERDGRAQVRSVRLGLRTLDAAEVLDGLAQGDIVLLGAEAKADKRVRVKMQAWQPSVSTGPGALAVSGASAPDAGAAMANVIGR